MLVPVYVTAAGLVFVQYLYTHVLVGEQYRLRSMERIVSPVAMCDMTLAIPCSAAAATLHQAGCVA